MVVWMICSLRAISSSSSSSHISYNRFERLFRNCSKYCLYALSLSTHTSSSRGEGTDWGDFFFSSKIYMITTFHKDLQRIHCPRFGESACCSQNRQPARLYFASEARCTTDSTLRALPIPTRHIANQPPLPAVLPLESTIRSGSACRGIEVFNKQSTIY